MAKSVGDTHEDNGMEIRMRSQLRTKKIPDETEPEYIPRCNE